MKRTPLKRRTRLRRVSKKVTRVAPEYRSVYEVVDARSGGRCEVNFTLEYILAGKAADLVKPGAKGFDLRCRYRAVDHHHLYKPRRSNHEPDLIVHLCRRHHERCEWPYQKGRLCISLENGVHRFQIRFAADKWAARAGQ